MTNRDKRQSLLDAARRKAGQAAAKRSSALSLTPAKVLGVYKGMAEDKKRVLVTIDDSEPLSLTADPGKYVIDGLVWVQVDAKRKPIHVLGPADIPGEGQETETYLPELTPEDLTARAAIESAQAAIEAARAEIAETGAELDGRLDDAFGQIDTALGDAANALSAATHNAKNLFATAPPSGTAPKGTLWFQRDSQGKIIGQWQQVAGAEPAADGTGGTMGSTWERRDITSEVIANLDVGKLSAGGAVIDEGVINRLWTDVVRSRKITTDMLLVGRGANLIVDPLFLDPTLTEARRTRSASTAVSGGFSQTGYFYFVGPTATQADAQKTAIPVQPGEQYRFSIPVTNGTTTMLYAERWTTAGVRSQETSTSANFKNITYAGGVLSGTYTVPTNVAYLSPVIYRASGTYVVGPGATATRLTDSSLIVDGGVAARHLNVVETVNGAKFSLQPDGLRIWRAGNTGTHPNVLLTLAGGFRLQADDGSPVAWLDSVTGTFRTTGGVIADADIIGSIIRTALTGQRWEISSSEGESNTLKAFSNSPNETQPGTIIVESETSLGNWPRMIIQTPEVDGNPLSRTTVDMVSGPNTDTAGYASYDVLTQRASINAPQGIDLNGPVGTVNVGQNDGLRFGDLTHRYVSFVTVKPTAARNSEVGAGSISRDASTWGTRGLSSAGVAGENLQFTRDGIYTITYTVNLPVAFRPTGTTRAFIGINSASFPMTYRASVGQEDWATVTTGPVYIPAGGVVSFPFFLGGAGTYNFSGRIAVLRHE